MRRTKTGLLPSVDAMEPRLLLSTAAPLLSRHALNGVVREIKGIVSTLARTEDTVQASAQLTGLSSQIPSGSAGLAASWQSDVGLYRPHSARSITRPRQRIVGDLDRFSRSIRAATGPVSGSGSTTSTLPPGHGQQRQLLCRRLSPGQGTTGTTTPVPTPSLDSVRIQNTTGLALVVTVHLEVPQIQQPYITETIPAQGIRSCSSISGPRPMPS